MRSSLLAPQSRSLFEFPAPLLSSFGAGADSKLIDARINSIRQLLSDSLKKLGTVSETDINHLALAEQLRAKLAAFKRMVATVAMHLDSEWRLELLKTLDRLLAPDDWEKDFRLPSEQSFSTFLRMIIYLHPTKRPGLGLSSTGNFLAAWMEGKDRIIIECVGHDQVRWVLSRTTDGERESAAGKALLYRIPEVTAPWNPEPLFADGEQVLA